MDRINNTHFFSGISDKLPTTCTKITLMEQWEEWAQKAQPGAGEQRDVALERLKECLEHGIPFLDLSSLNLTDLPRNWPDCLWDLSLCHNQLTYLPENLPNGLGTLEAKHNHLSRLPINLPPELEVMDVSHNQLTHLPENLPSSLEIIIASHNHLRHLPEHLPHHLEGLDVSHNQLTRVPDNLPNRIITLSISNNPVGIENETTLYFMIALNSLSNRIDINRWKDIAKEENAAIFFDFFLWLFQGENVSSVKFKQSVSTWIAELGKEENSDLRQQTFAIAKDGTENCIDRASYYFNLMYSLMIEHRLVQNDVPVKEIFQTLLGLFRLQEIESISAEHASKRRNKTPGFDEDIEIYLAYQYLLREEFALPIYTELQFSDIAGLTEENIMYAKDRILGKEKQKFIAFLVNDSAVWKRKITEWKREKVEAADNEFLEKLDKMTAGSATSDLYNIMDKNKTDEVHYKIFFPLTKDYLTEKSALQMLDGFHY